MSVSLVAMLEDESSLDIASTCRNTARPLACKESIYCSGVNCIEEWGVTKGQAL